MAALCVSSAMWCHVPLAKGRTLAQPRGPGRGAAAVRTILQWLLECGGRHRLELRMAASGGHSGIWLGVAGVGATPRDAEACGRRGKRELADALLAMNVADHGARPPALPRGVRGLVRRSPGRRLQAVRGLSATRSALPECGRKGSPLVLRMQFDLSRASGALVSEAARTLQSVESTRSPEPPWVMTSSGQLRRIDTPRRRALRVLDEAAALRIRVLVHGRSLPSALRLRILSDALQDDLGGTLAWAEDGEPIPCGVSVLEEGLGVLAPRTAVEDDDFIPF
jgi:hypothetical protein